MICYSTELDMPKEQLERFVADELRHAEREGYAVLEEKQKNIWKISGKLQIFRLKGMNFCSKEFILICFIFFNQLGEMENRNGSKGTFG